MSGELDDVKEEVAAANRILSYVGLASGVRASLGHVSVRLPNDPGKFLVKGRGYRRDVIARMRPEDMVTCNLEGEWVDGPDGSMPCHEVKMHSCIYKNRPDVLSVVHVHPTFTVILSTMGHPIKPIAQEGAQLVRRPLPVYPHCKTVVTEEEGQEVAKLLGNGDAVLMMGHGAATVGRSPQESVMRMYQLEHQAEMTYYAVAAFGVNHPSIPEAALEEMAVGSGPLPHFKERLAQISPQRQMGIWPHLKEMVTEGR